MTSRPLAKPSGFRGALRGFSQIERRSHPVFATSHVTTGSTTLEAFTRPSFAAQLNTISISWSRGGRESTLKPRPDLVAVEEDSVNTILDALDRFERSMAPAEGP